MQDYIPTYSEFNRILVKFVLPIQFLYQHTSIYIECNSMHINIILYDTCTMAMLNRWIVKVRVIKLYIFDNQVRLSTAFMAFGKQLCKIYLNRYISK